MIEQKLLERKIENKINSIYIDPSYSAFYSDGLFDLANPALNRDDQLLPFHRLREYLLEHDVSIRTADFLFNNTNLNEEDCSYYSLGVMDNLERVRQDKNTRLSAFVIMEPPVVAPHLYAALPQLTSVFDRVYVHNVEGDGYSLDGVCREKLRRLYWPLPYNDGLDPYWGRQERKKKIIVINGNHNPRSRTKELYSARIKAMVELSKFDAVDLYGQGWNIWWNREAWWLLYWRHRSTLMSIYKGTCVSKFETLQEYDFCLCLENMAMNGYITEKIFDCLYAGTIPLYLGAPDITKYIPPEVFIDCREYSSWTDMWNEVRLLPDSKIQAMRKAGRDFLNSEEAKPFYHSLENIVSEGL